MNTITAFISIIIVYQSSKSFTQNRTKKWDPPPTSPHIYSNNKFSLNSLFISRDTNIVNVSFSYKVIPMVLVIPSVRPLCKCNPELGRLYITAWSHPPEIQTGLHTVISVVEITPYLHLSYVYTTNIPSSFRGNGMQIHNFHAVGAWPNYKYN